MRFARIRTAEGEAMVSNDEFEGWFVRCIALCVNDDIGPNDYLWNLQEPGVWGDLFVAGLTPQEAVSSQFQRQ